MDIETRIQCAKNELAQLHQLIQNRNERAKNKLRIKLLDKELKKLQSERNSINQEPDETTTFEW
jgi:hypothetical protein